MAVISNIVDFDWLMSVPRHLIPFTPICSLYPLLLCIWFSLYYKKNIDAGGSHFREQQLGGGLHSREPVVPPTWFTAFICMGIISYGFMAWIYYPLSMSWYGFNLRSIGNMIWVTIYASQALLLIPEIKKLPIYQYLLIFGYFFFKDYADRFLGTFIDITIDDYPENLKLIFTFSIVILHILTAGLLIYLTYRKNEKFVQSIKRQNKTQALKLPQG